jgi:cephalosporin-C deacetylase
VIVDKPLEELRTYRPPLTAQPDFEAFWRKSLEMSDRHLLEPEVLPQAYPVERVQVNRVTYAGFGQGTRVHGWYLVPAQPLTVNVEGEAVTPVIVQFHGYTGSKGVPAEHLHWALQGFRVFAVDVRGQDGDTPDNQAYPSGSAKGYLTKGIQSPETYYYRYVYLDCLRAVDFVLAQAGTGPVFLSGASQGGGLTLAVAALGRERGIAAAMPDVPFLCHFRRAVEVFTAGSYQELVSHWQAHPDQVENNFQTLSYFDGLNFSPLIECPVLLSLGLLDTNCPPSGGFAVYNHLKVAKQIRIYPFSPHAGGGARHDQEKYAFVRQILQTNYPNSE